MAGVVDREAGVEPFPRLVAHGADSAMVRDGSMSGNDRLKIHAKNLVAGVNPVADGPGPENRVALDEQDVPGEHQLVRRNMDENVAPGISGHQDTLQWAELGERLRVTGRLVSSHAVETTPQGSHILSEEPAALVWQVRRRYEGNTRVDEHRISGGIRRAVV